MSDGEDLTAVHEQMLVVQAQERDPNAFHELVVRYERRLVYYIRRILGNGSDAYDVMQEVWLTVYRRLGSLRSPRAFRVWLYRLAHDIAVSHVRKRSRWPDVLPHDVVYDGRMGEWNELEALENAELVHRTIEQLSAVHREVLTLRFLEEMPLAEIAEVVGCGIGTVKSRLHYAKRELYRQLGGLDHDE